MPAGTLFLKLNPILTVQNRFRPTNYGPLVHFITLLPIPNQCLMHGVHQQRKSVKLFSTFSYGVLYEVLTDMKRKII